MGTGDISRWTVEFKIYNLLQKLKPFKNYNTLQPYEQSVHKTAPEEIFEGGWLP